MIEVRDLSKRFGSTLAVDHLSFSVRPGHVTGFLGPNGAGKTTTMKVVLGLDRPDGGEALVAGRRYVDLAAPLREVGALLDARAMHGGRRARLHLLCLAQSNGIRAGRVDEVLDLVGLTEVAGRRAGTFSLGMSQRLGIAAALLGDPPVLLFDEPVNGLDPEGIRWIRMLLRALAAEGRTVLVSSHLMSEMALTADQVIVIGKGRLIADAAIDDLVRTSSVRATLVHSPDLDRLVPVLRAAGGTIEPMPDGAVVVRGLDAPTVGRAAAETGAVLYELTPQAASLEEAYLGLTEQSVQFQTGAVTGTGLSPAAGAAQRGAGLVAGPPPVAPSPERGGPAPSPALPPGDGGPPPPSPGSG
ncbi:MAG TPA: ATP-binding cassette domain-containing protein [Acidimicrobiales bacterium]|nr:ATP-binding cassette domain-containing protein [Acidimicrobiales bacterium]